MDVADPAGPRWNPDPLYVAPDPAPAIVAHDPWDLVATFVVGIAVGAILAWVVLR